MNPRGVKKSDFPKMEKPILSVLPPKGTIVWAILHLCLH